LEKSWSGKNIDLRLLSARLSTFLEENYFGSVRKEEIQKGYQIFAEDSPFFNSDEYVDVTVEGQPNDFTISVNLFRKKKGRFQVSPLLLSMVGAGYLYLKRLKSRENFLFFEREFWSYVENNLLSLADSALLSSHESKG